MAQHSKFGSAAGAHQMTKVDEGKDNKDPGREEVASHDESVDEETAAQDNNDSPKSVLARHLAAVPESFGGGTGASGGGSAAPAVPSSMTNASSQLSRPNGSGGGHAQVLQATMDYLGAQARMNGRMLRNLMYHLETLRHRQASELAGSIAGIGPGHKIIPKLVFMKSCLPEHLKAPTRAEIAAGAEPVVQRELPFDARRLIFQYMFQVEEPLCLDSPNNLLRRYPASAGMLKFLETTSQPFKGEDDNTKFDVLSLLGRQSAIRKRIASFMNLLGTCKEINEEAGMVLYGANTLTFLDSDRAKDFLDKLSRRSCRHIRTLVIKFEAGGEGHRRMTNAIIGIHRNCSNIRTIELKGVIMEATNKLKIDDDYEFESMKTNLLEKGIVPFSRKRLTVQEGYPFLEHSANHPSGIIKYNLLPTTAVIRMTGYTELFIKPYVEHFQRHNSHVLAQQLVKEVLASVRVLDTKAKQRAAKEYEKVARNGENGEAVGDDTSKAADDDKDYAVKKAKEWKRVAGLDLTVDSEKKRKAETLNDNAKARKKRHLHPLNSQGETSKTKSSSSKGKRKVDYLGDEDDTEEDRVADDFGE